MSKIPGRSRGFSFSALVCGVVWGNRNTSVSFCKYTGRLEVEVRVWVSMGKISRVQCEYRDCRGESKCLAATAKMWGICGGAWGQGRDCRIGECQAFFYKKKIILSSHKKWLCFFFKKKVLVTSPFRHYSLRPLLVLYCGVVARDPPWQRRF
jgi:hypothetical protein